MNKPIQSVSNRRAVPQACAALLLSVGGLSVAHAADCVSGQNYDASTTCTVPAGVTSISVQAWGAGGSAGPWDAGAATRDGGGGGSYCAGTVTVTGGSALTITVGLGGIVTDGLTAQDGGSSGVGTVVAPGGSKGNYVSGGAGGLACSGTDLTGYAGGNGGARSGFNWGAGGGGGGSATSSAAGSAGTSAVTTTAGVGGSGEGAGGNGGTSTNPGSNGAVPGGGGGGAGYNASSNYTKGRGGDGRVILTFTAPPIDGACGSANAATPLVTSAPSVPTELCSAGTPGTVTEGNEAYTWTCAGTSGGNDSGTCSAGRGYTVTPSAGANGSISPSTPQVVAYNNAAPSFTVSPDSGYQVASVTGCGGTLTGSTYTTGAVTADCSVDASFSVLPPTPTVYEAPSPTGSGTVRAEMSCIGGGCGFSSGSYVLAGQAGGTPPAGYTFPHGVLSFTSNSAIGGTVTLTLTYPQTLPVGTKFYKYGPATPGAPSSWYEHPATISGNTITYSVTDGGQGDSNDASGIITDPAGPAVPVGAASVPTLGEWALLALAGLMALLGLGAARRREHHNLP